MRAVLTRVKHASVSIDGKETARIGEGFLILLGVTHEDTEAQAVKLAEKLTGLRSFSPPPAPRSPFRSTRSSCSSAATRGCTLRRASSARICRSRA